VDPNLLSLGYAMPSPMVAVETFVQTKRRNPPCSHPYGQCFPPFALHGIFADRNAFMPTIIPEATLATSSSLASTINAGSSRLLATL
jgi:hypothetical protein